MKRIFSFTAHATVTVYTKIKAETENEARELLNGADVVWDFDTDGEPFDVRLDSQADGE